MVDLDMRRHYRPLMNVVQRSTLQSGKAHQLTGHHEIMALRAWSIVERLGRGSPFASTAAPQEGNRRHPVWRRRFQCQGDRRRLTCAALRPDPIGGRRLGGNDRDRSQLLLQVLIRLQMLLYPHVWSRMACRVPLSVRPGRCPASRRREVRAGKRGSTDLRHFRHRSATTWREFAPFDVHLDRRFSCASRFGHSV